MTILLLPISNVHDLLCADDLAKEIHVSPATLARWRGAGTGPKFMNAGRRILYALPDINAWLQASSRTSTSSVVSHGGVSDV